MVSRPFSFAFRLTPGHCHGGLSVLLAVIALVLGVFTGPVQSQEDRGRIISLGGSVTEIVYALGASDRLVGRDTTSTWPEAALALPNVGYVRALSPEGVLSLDPGLIIAIEGSGPPETLEVLDSASVPLVTVPEGYDMPAIRAKIETVAEALGLPEDGTALADRVEAELAAAVEAARTDTPPRVLFILSMQGGRIMAAGAGTAAQGIIELAGGVNALEGFSGYQQISDEAVLLAAPDVILMMDRTGDHAMGDDAMRAHPVLRHTPAVEAGRIVRQPGTRLLGFGPRTPEAVRALADAFQTTGS